MSTKELAVNYFEDRRSHLRGLAFRILGSASEAEDAVQEAWIRLSNANVGSIDNLGGWLTRVVSRICLDQLRVRNALRESELDDVVLDSMDTGSVSPGPEDEALFAESIGAALMILLTSLPAPERVAFVLHDIYDLAFVDIAALLGRSEEAARQLASRGRRRIRAPRIALNEVQALQREVVAKYLHASRSGDFESLLKLLAGDVVLEVDAHLSASHKPVKITGASAVARVALAYSKALIDPVIMLLDGRVGFVLADEGKPKTVVRFIVLDGLISKIETGGDPAAIGKINYIAVENTDVATNGSERPLCAF